MTDAQKKELLLVKKKEIDNKIVKEKIALWERYLKGEVGVSQAMPTIFSDQSKITALQNEYYDYWDNVLQYKRFSWDLTCYRDDSPEILEIRDKYIQEMNLRIDALRARWQTLFLNPTMTDAQKKELQIQTHLEAENWRAKIKAVGGIPSSTASGGDITGNENDIGIYFDKLKKKYTDPETIPLDSFNEIYTNRGRSLGKFYRSFAGSDAIASLVFPGQRPIVMGEVSTLSYSIYRQKTPVNTLGRISPKGFTKGTRTVAGSMIFTMTNQHWVNEVKEVLRERSLSKGDTNNPFENIKKLKADELPPFDIILTFANEYGANCYYAIYGVTIVEEGQIVSVEDAITENVCQFLARDLDVASVNTLEPITGRSDLRPDDYSNLAKFSVNSLISDDAYERAQKAKADLMPDFSNKPPVDTVIYDGTIRYTDEDGHWVTIDPEGNMHVTETHLHKPLSGNITLSIQFLDSFTDELLEGFVIKYTIHAIYNLDTTRQKHKIGEGTTTAGTGIAILPIRNPSSPSTDESMIAVISADIELVSPTNKEFNLYIASVDIVNFKENQMVPCRIDMTKYFKAIRGTNSEARVSINKLFSETKWINDLRSLNVWCSFLGQYKENVGIKWTVRVKRAMGVKYRLPHSYTRQELNKDVKIEDTVFFWSRTDSNGYADISRSLAQSHMWEMSDIKSYVQQLESTKNYNIDYNNPSNQIAQGPFVNSLESGYLNMLLDTYDGLSEDTWFGAKGCTFELSVTVEAFQENPKFDPDSPGIRIGRPLEYTIALEKGQSWSYAPSEGSGGAR